MRKRYNIVNENFVTLDEYFNDETKLEAPLAWNFWNFIKGTGKTPQESQENLEVFGKILGDKFGNEFSLQELEDWLANLDNEIEDVINDLKLDIDQLKDNEIGNENDDIEIYEADDDDDDDDDYDIDDEDE